MKSTPIKRKVNTPSKETVMKPATSELGFSDAVRAFTSKHQLVKDKKCPKILKKFLFL